MSPAANITAPVGLWRLTLCRPRRQSPFNPTACAYNAGTTASFSVEAGGSGPLGYQWRKDGVPLADGGNIAGAATAMLVLTNVLGGDAGGYSVVVSNGLGSVTSAVATLVVIDPLIAVQPVSQLGKLGDSVTFSVTAVGTAPLGYQWWKDGAALAWGTGASLTLTNLEVADAGDYWVVVSNQYGNVTSAVALLTVNGATLDSGFNPGAEAIPCIPLGVLHWRSRPTGRFWWAAISPRWAGRAAQPLGGSMPTGRWTRVQSGGETIRVLPWRCRRTGRFWWAAISPRWAGRRATTLAGSMRTGHWTPGSIRGRRLRWYSLAVQADGKILVGGEFTTLGGQSAQLHWPAECGRDTGQRLQSGGGRHLRMWIRLAVQADGKILVGGDFTTLGGQTRNYLGRLNADGTLDSGFNPGADGIV